MNQRVQKKWLAALRGGKYQQTRHKLRDGQQFCCLGVLCDLHSKETGRQWHYDGPTDQGYDGDFNGLPPSVQAWAGLPRYPMVEYQGRPIDIATLNDLPCSFVEIADLIEQCL